jgi:DNA-binding MarR family transcriptional regulator
VKAKDIDIDLYVPALINTLSSKLTASASVTYRSALGVSIVEWRMLVALERSGRSLSVYELAALVGQDKGPVSRALRRLESKRLVTVEAAERGRRLEVTVTPAGRDLYQQSLPLAGERESRLLEGLSQTERDQLVVLLRKMLDRVPTVAAIDGGALVRSHMADK